VQDGVTVAESSTTDRRPNPLRNPDGLYVDDDLSIYVADHTNNRIVKWTKGAEDWQVIVGGNPVGCKNDRLLSPADVVVDKTTGSLIISEYNNRRVVRWPRQNAITVETLIANVSCWGLSMDNDGYLYVSDYQNNEVKRWKIGDANGVTVAGGNGEGGRVEQLNGPTHIFVDNDRSLYVSDMKNHRVMKWLYGAEQGIVVAGGHFRGNSLRQLCSPFGIAVDRSGNVYIVDRGNHRVVRWRKGATEGAVVVGGHGPGNQSNQLSSPTGLSFDRHGHIYVADDENHRVQKFLIDYNSKT
jgi:sugar lactone lactonase YvrE